MGKHEKTLLLRFDLDRKTDREIWEWLHEKSVSQTLSMNAFLIEGLRERSGLEPLPVFAGRFGMMLRSSPWKYRSIPCGLRLTSAQICSAKTA